MFQYLIQTIAFQLFFLMVYDFLLKRETFFNWNRVYLLGTAIISLIIPLIKIEGFKNVVSKEYIITLPQVFLGKVRPEANILLLEPTIISQQPVWSWDMIFLIGIAIATLLFIFKLIKMVLILAKNPKYKVNNFYIVKLLHSSAAFSFFKYIFLGELITEADKKTILKHEMVHVKQYHSADLLLFEILRILFWFNPLIYMYQGRIVALHEFIADAKSVNTENKKVYYENLLSQVFDTKKISFINPFFKQSLIKKRIVMLQKSKSKQIHLLKYSLLIPVILGMLIYTSCSSQSNEKESSISNQIEILKSMVEKNNGVLSESDKAELFKLINGKEIGKWKVVEGVFNPNTNEIDVPFAVIDQAPLFPGCEGLEKENQKGCMSKSISEFVANNFNTKIANEHNLTGRQRINVIFKVDTEGQVTGVRARAPHPALEEEAIRVINSLPKMIPGEHKGKKVNVPYNLPIIFEVAEDMPKVDKE
ncbi:blaR1 peptidase M56 family protein [Seonamhaeicola sediminis]|uniref:BlaR1 peptidase M56 family protein n=1 Tax=Seonamhaeicola sediminis TaxID=2528206 RepID=A0A562YI70_9FLAO|nr:M56 family metallopeptidase [Seonamhaeicola sediminis]TWO34743.1 blaR1 peptidase M56 family protein [Seonamhaeicola sediminis]